MCVPPETSVSSLLGREQNHSESTPISSQIWASVSRKLPDFKSFETPFVWSSLAGQFLCRGSWEPDHFAVLPLKFLLPGVTLPLPYPPGS